jgi:hypothetical protein
MSGRLNYLPLLLCLAGCDDPIKHVELIEEPRVLGARAEVVGDAGRATPHPGETLEVRWLVAAPDGDPPTGFALHACSAPRQTRGLLRCASRPFASDILDAASENPRFEFTLPADLDPLAEPRVGVLGSLCVHGNGRFAGDTPGCEGGEELSVSLDLFVASSDGVNLNPSFGSEAIALDGSPWQTQARESGACLGHGLPEVSLAGGQHQIQIGIPEAARETLSQRNPADLTRESLRVAHFASRGKLERPFSEILPDDVETSVSLSWDPPETAPPEGELVRFWFVLRDLRGGSDFTERALCIVP